MPDAVLIAGANGAGKTTLARRLLPAAYPDARFLNADEIQREGGFSSALAAGRELISRLKAVSEVGGSFVVETTLSSASYGRQFAAWRARGYWVTVHYIEVVSADFAVARVARRVAAGGHDIPELDIRRRYDRGRFLFPISTVPRPMRGIITRLMSEDLNLSKAVKAPARSGSMVEIIETAVRQATWDATQGPAYLRAGRFDPKPLGDARKPTPRKA